MIVNDYLKNVEHALESAAKANVESLDQAAQLIADAYLQDRTIYVFGCTHSAILAEDVFYRAGAPAFWRPLWAPGLSVATTPGYLTTSLEHSCEVGEAIIDNSQISTGDVIVVISSSGKNAAPVAVAEGALKRGARLIVISSSNYRDLKGNHPRIPSLWALADQAVMIDNCVPRGDVSITVADCPMGPLSTIVGSFLMHSLSAKAVEKLAEGGVNPPAFRSSNAPGGAAFNQELLNRPHMRETYMLP